MRFCNKLFFIGMVTLLLVTNLFGQWEPDVRLTYDDSLSQICQSNTWSVAADGNNNVHVVWGDKRDGNRKIYYKRSTDGGSTWGTDIRLTDALPWSGAPGIAVSNSYVHTVWNDDRDGNSETYYKRSTDAGTNWGTDTRLTNDPAHTNTPCVAVSNSYVHVVVDDERDGNYEIYYKRSTDGGSTWGTDTRLTDDPGYSGFPSVAASGSNVHVVWYDPRDGNGEIYYKLSSNGGTTWGVDTRLTNDPASSGNPCVAVSGSKVHVVWFDERDGNFEIYYKHSPDGGTSWGTDTRLTDDPGYSGSPSVAASGSNVHVVWYDQRDGNGEIYYKLSSNGGTTWGVDTRLTNDPASSGNSCVAVSGSIVHVVWNDGRDGNSEIYYKRNPTGNAVYEQDLRHRTIDVGLLCHPNPFTDKVNIKLGMYDGKSKMDGISLEIYDVSGRLVKAVPLTTNYLSLTTDFKAGVYFLKVEGYELVKVVKLR